MSIVKNKTTLEGLKFWEHVELVAAQVENWPKWMRGKISAGRFNDEEYERFNRWMEERSAQRKDRA